ncbi:hypothetical protein [Burkholderia paludis]|uniref:hypothetical protein n=1 Tax=Burkholderia paludis TaxID=1506587 RepID=UPI0009DD935D|nr:hypothetical protein [Burkholderia paludis]
MKNRGLPAGLMGVAVLLTACGGGDGGGSSTRNNGSAASTARTATNGTTEAGSQAVPDGQASAVKCPDSYKSIQVTSSAIPDATMTLVTDDGIATLTFKTLPDGVVRDGTICRGKPDPVPAGVTADYVYEIKAYGAFDTMFNRTLTLNFKTDVIPDPNPPVVEMADQANGTVIYKPTLPGSVYSVRPNCSLAVAANFPGLYVVRLTQ